MKPWITRAGALAIAALVLQPSHAGPIREFLKERAEARREAAGGQQGARGAMTDMEEAEGGQGEVPLPPGASAERDVSYGSDPAQKLDVYLPKNAGKAPVIFMVHGGAWITGDKRNGSVVTNKIGRWLPKGFVVVSVNYRLSPKADPVEQAADVAKALAFAQGKAASWGADPSRFVLMGHSAGAHLVSLLTADPGIASRAGAKPWLGTVSLDSAAFNVVEIMETRHYRFYDKVFKDDKTLWRDASPTLVLKQAPVPMLIVCSTKRSDSCPQAKAFAAKANGMGGKVKVHEENLTHRDVNLTLGQGGGYTDEVESFLRSIGLS